MVEIEVVVNGYDILEMVEQKYFPKEKILYRRDGAVVVCTGGILHGNEITMSNCLLDELVLKFKTTME